MKKSTLHRRKKFFRPKPRGDVSLVSSLRKFREWMEFCGLDPSDYDISELRLSVFDFLVSLKELDRTDLEGANPDPAFYFPTLRKNGR
jgi:hypothetical protein